MVTKVKKILRMEYGVNLTFAKQWVFSSQVPNRKRFNDHPAREYLQAEGKGWPQETG